MSLTDKKKMKENEINLVNLNANVNIVFKEVECNMQMLRKYPIMINLLFQ